MEQNSFNLPIRSMSVISQEAIDYIKGRRDHSIVSLKTRWSKLNKQTMGGIEPNVVWTISGISGSGKSSIANEIAFDIIDLNPHEEIVELVFSLEMVGFRQIGRALSNKLRLTTSALYSSEKDLDDNTLGKVVTVASQLKKYPIYFVDNPGTPTQIRETIKTFYENNIKGTNKHFVIIYDHALLTKQVGSAIETISELERVFIEAKKLPFTSVIQLAQMNRNIEQSERINNSLVNYPMRSDISSSDSIFQASDYVMVVHRPEILGIQEYGPNHLPTANKVYLHILKNRDAGKPCILEFENDLMYNNLIES